MSRKLCSNQHGQTVVALLVFMLVAIMLTTTSTVIIAVNTRSNNSVLAGDQARLNAEAGVEAAFQSILRNPGYTGGTVTMPSGTATISVSGAATRTIISQGTSGTFRRTITATATLSGNTWTLSTWRETP